MMKVAGDHEQPPTEGTAKKASGMTGRRLGSG